MGQARLQGWAHGQRIEQQLQALQGGCCAHAWAAQPVQQLSQQQVALYGAGVLVQRLQNFQRSRWGISASSYRALCCPR